MTVSREEFEDVKQLVATLARISERQTRSIDELTHSVADLRTSVADLRASIVDVVGMLTEQAEQAERDRNQANIERAEFRTTVRDILDALTQRFSGNGQ